MSRISLVTPEGLGPEQKRVYDLMASGPLKKVEGPMLAALHQPELADKWQQLGRVLRFGTSIPARVTELAILVTARIWNSEFVWQYHEPLAVKAGLPATAVAAIRLRQTPVFESEDDQDIYDYCSQLHLNHAVMQETYDRVLSRWGTVGLVELTTLLGYYVMSAMTIAAHEILPESGTRVLPV